MKSSLNYLGVAVLVLALAVSAGAQTATPQTALSAAIPGNQPGTITFSVSSTTGMTASGTGNIVSTGSGQQTFLAIDGELFQLTAVNSATSVTARRAQGGVATPHPSGALVFWGPGGSFVPSTGNTSGVFITSAAGPNGSCTATSNQYLPVLKASAAGIEAYSCPNSVWRKTVITIPTGYRVPRKPVSNEAYTALDTDYIIAYTLMTAARTVTLPTAVGREGKIYIVKNESSYGSHTIWVATVEGGNDAVVGAAGAYPVSRYYSNGTVWLEW